MQRLGMTRSWRDGIIFRNRGSRKMKKSPPTLDEAEEVLELEKRHLKKLLSFALLVPTPENVENYLEKQNRWVNQSAKFADTWGKVLLQKPNLGDFLINPTTNYGVLAKRDADLTKRKALLQKLSKTCFLLFFFRGKDPFSEKAAEIGNLFASHKPLDSQGHFSRWTGGQELRKF